VLFIFPIGVEDQAVDRMPWVSITIAALCALVFAGTWVLPAHPDPSQKPLGELIVYWTQHPYLQPPADPAADDLSQPIVDRIRALGRPGAAPADADTLAAEQRQLDELIDSYHEAAERNPFRRWGLVPARGLRQAGWITHLFLHLGWMHILGNLFFFYLVGPLLEDIWGRPFFAGFYLLSGLIAGAAQAALNPSSQIYVVGASGAIAGCMGAFTWRFARRRIKLAYFFWFLIWKRGTYEIAAWLAGLLWFGQQLLYFLLVGRGGGGGVAFMAHLGGFAFGLGVAVVLGLTGFEKKVMAPAVEAKAGVWTESVLARDARAALEAGRPGDAAALAQQALGARADDREALVTLARVAARSGDGPGAARQLERALLPVLGHTPDSAWQLVDEMGADFRPQGLSPALAFRLATAMASAPEGLAGQREALYLEAAAAGGPLGAKALLGAAELRLAADAAAARSYVQRASALPDLPPELRQKIAELEARLPREISLDLPGERSARVTPARLQALLPSALDVQTPKGARRLALREVQAIGVGAVPAVVGEGTRPRKRLVIDLITSWGNAVEGPEVIRLSSDTLAPQRFFPDVPPMQGYARLIAAIGEGSGATVLPDAGAVGRGAYATFESLEAFEAALYASAA
jgi:membrane associated rhomboid family serine protease